MKKLVASSFLSLTALLAVVVGCDPPPAEGEGEGREGEGEGEEGEGEEGEGEEGEGEEGEGEPLEGSCTSDADCAAGTQTCATLIQGQDSFCYNLCEAGAACTTTIDRPGTCIAIAQGGPTMCVELSGNLGPCGNPLNAGCDVQNGAPGICLSGPDGAGFCTRLCNPNDDSTCNTPNIPPQANACGCAENEVCSTSPNIGAPNGDGLCTLPSVDGESCGINAATLALDVCSPGQTCDGFAPPNTLAGVCNDAAEGEGEGEGEGE